MQNNKIISSQEIYHQYLGTINGIKFTPREVDVIAFLLCGRATKKIASSLSIAPKTVETHTRNIMQKLKCNSKESIIDFIEKAGKFLTIKDYYLSLLAQAAFEQKLKEIASLKGKDSPLCLLFIQHVENKKGLLVLHLEESLKLADIRLLKERGKKHKTLDHLTQYAKAKKINYIFYTLPKSLITPSQTSNKKMKLKSLPLILKEASQNPNFFILLLQDTEDLVDVSQIANTASCISFGKQEYYSAVFEILKRVLSTVNLNKVISEFNKTYDDIYNTLEGSTTESSKMWLEEKSFLQAKKIYYTLPLNILKKRGTLLLLGSILCLSLIYVLFLKAKGVKMTLFPQNVETRLAQSDFPLPTEAILLKRPQLIKQMEERFKSTEDIQIIALVGIGGAGKTTLARQYSRYQKSSVSWEMNAETKGSLIHSFENLAYVLSRTEEEKKILKGLQEINNAQEREEKLLLFVKDHLRSQPNWFLLFDNVEKFADIQKYFPTDAKIWGKGKVIITTRDSNIKNNAYISHTVQIGELEPQEKLEFFSKILNNGNASSFTDEKRKQVENFLKNIPSFPLDISIAAYYLKTMDLSYEKYSEHLREHDKDFETLQENIFSEMNDYGKIRCSIINVSLQKLINIHKDFADLLLFISLLNHKNIPKDLLNKYKNETVVENFIYHLKKYSLLLDNSFSSSRLNPTFSLHRSTQEVSLVYLIKTLGLKTDKKSLQAIVEAFEANVVHVVDHDEQGKIRSLIAHCKAFLKHDNLLTEEMKSSLGTSLGSLYYCLSRYEKAQEALEKALAKLGESAIANYPLKARTLVYLGAVVKIIGKAEKAKELMENSLTIYRDHIPHDQEGMTWVLLNLGDIYRLFGDYKKAKNMLEESLAVYKKNNSKNHLGKARAFLYLGIIYRHLGDYEKSGNILEQSLAIYKKHTTKDHPRIARTLTQIGNLNRNLGNYKKAKDLTEQSLTLYKKHFSEDHIDVGWASVHLGRVYTSLGKYEEAKNLLEQSLVIYKKYYPENHIRVAWVLLHLGTVYKNLGQYTQAKILLERSLKTYERHFGQDHTQAARVLVILGQVYLLEGNLEIAENLINQSLRVFQQNTHPESYVCLESLSDLYRQKSLQKIREGDVQSSQIFKKQAIDYLKQALEIVKSHFPENSPHLIKIQSKIKILES